ncbi:MAG: hypothetical protein ACKVRP_14865 [Bacteroidota bacterium]
MKHSVIVVAMLILGIGCASRSTFVERDYADSTMSGRSLVIATVMPTLLNPEDVTTNLGDGIPMDVFLNFFHTEFVKAMHVSSTFKDIFFSSQNSSAPLHWQSTTLDDGRRLKLMLPPENSRLTFDSIQTDFVLLIGRFTIRRNDPEPAYDVGRGVTGGSSGSLSQTVDYAIWDNAKGKMVAYGQVLAETQVSVFQLNRWNWESCVTLLAKRIVEDTPFMR